MTTYSNDYNPTVKMMTMDEVNAILASSVCPHINAAIEYRGYIIEFSVICRDREYVTYTWDVLTLDAQPLAGGSSKLSKVTMNNAIAHIDSLFVPNTHA